MCVCKYLDGRIFRKKGCISLYVCHKPRNTFMVPELQQKPINDYISYIFKFKCWKLRPTGFQQAPSKEQAVIPQQLKGWMMIYNRCQAGGMMQIIKWYIEYILFFIYKYFSAYRPCIYYTAVHNLDDPFSCNGWVRPESPKLEKEAKQKGSITRWAPWGWWETSFTYLSELINSFMHLKVTSSNLYHTSSNDQQKNNIFF